MTRLGQLRNGNPAASIDAARAAPRCGAKTRRGSACQCPAMRGSRRCRIHGGLSRGPVTAEGLARSRRARWVHGERSYIARAARRAWGKLLVLMARMAAGEPVTWADVFFQEEEVRRLDALRGKQWPDDRLVAEAQARERAEVEG